MSPPETASNSNGGVPAEVDMGYEVHHPATRRNSMTVDQERERRASIKAILADDSLAPIEKRKSIQHLMDGRRSSLSGTSRRSSMSGASVASSVNEDAGSVVSYSYDKEFFISNAETRRAEEQRPSCHHYQRNCTIIAPCCGAAFGCRICHDECSDLPPKISNAGQYQRSASLPSSFTSTRMPESNDDTHHNIDRFAIREVICRNCYTRQSSKTNKCISCRCQFGTYHCRSCNLWMNDVDQPYHCEDCGFCRVGGAENFQHCDGCGMCIDRNLFDTHHCKDGKYKSNCPVCQENLFDSRAASHEMPCGHAIHWECFRELAAHDSRCPICKKTAETRERMMPTWEAMAAGVAIQPVPPELARVVNITCNDCERNEDARAWHYLGIQCHHCSSFNTVVDAIVLSGEEAHDFLETQANGGTRPPERRRSSRRLSSIL
ncbi:hypothetical protein ACA910_015776 [Epithemia clementina (nom. ined.)]